MLFVYKFNIFYKDLKSQRRFDPDTVVPNHKETSLILSDKTSAAKTSRQQLALTTSREKAIYWH